MPYSNLPDSAFWSRCRRLPDFGIDGLFQPKFQLEPGMRIATAGSCFAQNIGRYAKMSALEFVDVEPKPRLMPDDIAARHGYGLFSARYGNIYTIRQLRDLLDDVQHETLRDCAVWQKNERFYDALRPNVEPNGYASELELAVHRLDHLRRVKQMFDGLDVFIFTLGLTECWIHRETGTVFPVAPGVIAGTFDPDIYAFHHARLPELSHDLTEAIAMLRTMAPQLKVILTVSPVPLAATASGQHVLHATTYAKSALRAVAEEVALSDQNVDYFPSYEIITGMPYGAAFYGENLRNVTQQGVETVMSTFFGAYPSLVETEYAPRASDNTLQSITEDIDETICEEALLDALEK